MLQKRCKCCGMYSYTILYHSIPFYTILYHSNYTILYHCIPFYIILYQSLSIHLCPYYLDNVIHDIWLISWQIDGISQIVTSMRLAYHYYYPFLYLPMSQSTTTACWRPNPNRLPTCSAFGRSDGQHAHVLTHEKHVEIPGTLSSSKANIEFCGYLWNSMDIMKFYGYL